MRSQCAGPQPRHDRGSRCDGRRRSARSGVGDAICRRRCLLASSAEVATARRSGEAAHHSVREGRPDRTEPGDDGDAACRRFGRQSHDLHDLAYAERPTLPKNPHGFMVGIGAAGGFLDIGLPVQRQIATFFALTAPRSSFHSPPASLRCRARRHCPKIWVPYVERPRYGTAATAAGSAPDRGPGGPRWITGGESRDRPGRGRRRRVGDRGDRRVAELDSGAVKTIPWAEVRRRLTGR